MHPKVRELPANCNFPLGTFNFCICIFYLVYGTLHIAFLIKYQTFNWVVRGVSNAFLR